VGGPLDGYRVVDLSQVVSGPLSTMILSDQGAEVIKVEPVVFGDVGRIGVPWGGITPFFVNHNRGKRSLALDLGDESGRDIVRSLADRADVFVQNFRPGVIERLGMGPDQLLARNPDLIYVSVSGYGPSGPYADRRVYDPIIQGVTGYVAMQCNPQLPYVDVVRTVVVDKATAWMVAQAVTAALLARERGTVRGQHLEIPMIDAALAFLWSDGMMCRTFLDDPEATARLTLAETMAVTRCADGEVTYFVATDDDAKALYRALGRPEWCDDERFATMAGRQVPANQAVLGELLSAEFATSGAAEILARMVAEGVPCGPVNTLAEVVDDPQVRHNGLVWEWEHPTAGRVRQTRPAARFSVTPQAPRPSAPLHGEHSDEILSELGFDAESRAGLRARGVIA